MFGLFAKKCMYCNQKIERDKEIKRDVKVVGYVGTFPKNFCSEEHASSYERETEEHLKQSKGGGCCG